jgi:hypothetical protein
MISSKSFTATFGKKVIWIFKYKYKKHALKYINRGQPVLLCQNTKRVQTK